MQQQFCKIPSRAFNRVAQTQTRFWLRRVYGIQNLTRSMSVVYIYIDTDRQMLGGTSPYFVLYLWLWSSASSAAFQPCSTPIMPCSSPFIGPFLSSPAPPHASPRHAHSRPTSTVFRTIFGSRPVIFAISPCFIERAQGGFHRGEDHGGDLVRKLASPHRRRN